MPGSADISSAPCLDLLSKWIRSAMVRSKRGRSDRSEVTFKTREMNLECEIGTFKGQFGNLKVTSEL